MRIQTADFRSNYLTIGGKYLTVSGLVVRPAARSGAIAATTLTDWVKGMGFRELSVNFTVGAPSGTGPSLQLKFLVLDPIESSNGTSSGNSSPPVVTLKLTPSAITAATHVRLVISHGVATVWIEDVPTVLGNLNVPVAWQCALDVGGSYGTGQGWPILGTFEMF